MGNQKSRSSRSTRGDEGASQSQHQTEDSSQRAVSVRATNLVSPKCGQWAGVYSQYGQQYPFTMDLLFFDDQRVSGSGFDEIGPFEIHGDFNRLTGQISFDKKYIGRHTVQYAGTITDEGKKISGLYWNSDTFEMTVVVTKPIQPMVLKVTEAELSAGVLQVQYSCSSDQYVRPYSMDDDRYTAGWSNCVWLEENMYRKVEYDWQMVYLSRSPDTSAADVGCICWKFDLGDHEIDRVKLTLKSTTFKTGKVSWSLETDDSRVVDVDALINGQERDESFPGNKAIFSGEDTVVVETIQGSSGFILKATLSKGKEYDDVAWQHAQLFRQPVGEKDVYPFDVQIFVKKSQDWQMLKTSVEANKYMYDHRHLASDIQFLVGADHVPIDAHKYVLISRSPVFFTMFYGGLSPEGDQPVPLPDTEASAFLEFLRFLYYDEVNINPDNVFEIFYTAQKYLVSSLTKKCIRFIVTQLSIDNCCSVLTQAVLCDEVQLMSKTLSFMLNSLSEVYQNESYKDLSLHALVYVLKNSDIDTKSAQFRTVFDVWLQEECTRQQLTVSASSRQLVTSQLKAQIPSFPL